MGGKQLLNLQKIKEDLKEVGATPSSFSKINSYFNCPYSYSQRYIKKEKKPYIRGGTGQVVGKFIHEVLEKSIKQGIEQGFNNIDFLLIWAITAKTNKLLHEEITAANAVKDKTEVILNKVLKAIKVNELKPFPELWINHWIDPERKQSYGKFVNGGAGLKDPDKFWQGSVDLLMITKDGWGEQGLILDYKTYESDKYKADIYSDMQLLMYAVLVFYGFPNLQSIKYGKGVIPTESIDIEGTLQRELLCVYEDRVFDFVERFIKQLQISKETNFFLHKKNDFCNYCDYILSCKRDAEFQCFNNKDNKLICGKNSELCHEGCINLTK